MKTIEGFMSEITDEFKIVVVDAIRTLCLKFPSKQATMVNARQKRQGRVESTDRGGRSPGLTSFPTVVSWAPGATP